MTKAAKAKAARKWRSENPDKVFDIDLWRRYRIRLVDYEAILRKQGYRCAICKSQDPKKRSTRSDRFHVDHDHVTGKVRGLLCFTCNAALGLFKDNLQLLKQAQRYLQRN